MSEALSSLSRVALTASLMPDEQTANIEGQVVPGPGASAITLFIDGQPHARMPTDDEGRFRRSIDAQALGFGPHRVWVQAHATQPGWLTGTSKTLQISFPNRAQRSPHWTLVPLALACLTLVWVVVQLVQHPTATTRPAAKAPRRAAVSVTPFASGRDPVSIQIRVQDVLDEEPLEAELMIPSRAHPLRPDSVWSDAIIHCPLSGRELTPVPPTLWVRAAGYAPLEARFSAGGEAIIRLTPIRAAIQDAFAVLVIFAA